VLRIFAPIVNMPGIVTRMNEPKLRLNVDGLSVIVTNLLNNLVYLDD